MYLTTLYWHTKLLDQSPAWKTAVWFTLVWFQSVGQPGVAGDQHFPSQAVHPDPLRRFSKWQLPGVQQQRLRGSRLRGHGENVEVLFLNYLGSLELSNELHGTTPVPDTHGPSLCLLCSALGSASTRLQSGGVQRPPSNHSLLRVPPGAPGWRCPGGDIFSWQHHQNLGSKHSR